jgi:hypothetical protein
MRRMPVSCYGWLGLVAPELALVMRWIRCGADILQEEEEMTCELSFEGLRWERR